MPDPDKPTGADFYIGEGYQDWQKWADKGAQFIFLKSRQGDWSYDGPPNPAHNVPGWWFSKSWQGVKDAGMLRAPYLFPMAAKLTIANAAAVTPQNWTTWPIDDVSPEAGVNHTDGEKSLDYILQQANTFCDEILAQGWGQPGDLPPAVDIESTNYFTGGQPVPWFPAAPGHAQTDQPEIWQRLAQADRINAIVVLVVQIERRLGVKPFIYCGSGWWEHIDAVDNGGAGYTVNHRGDQFQVAHFGDYPLWCLAHTTAVAGEIVIPRTWAFRPPPAEPRFIWQFQTAPLDLNCLVQMSASRPNTGPHQPPNTVIATVTEITDMTFLETMAKIVKPPAPRALTLISPPPIDPAPHGSFNILVIGQHFNHADLIDAARRMWSDPAHQTSITDSVPFASLARASRVACYADDGTGVFLKIRQTPSNLAGFDDVLAIPPDAADRLQSYLAQLQIQAPDGSATLAKQVWLPQLRLTGAKGTLVVVLRNNPSAAQLQQGQVAAQTPAELYQLDPSENYPVPLIAINIESNDQLWPQVVVRALAQNLGSLADEYERPEDAFDHPDDNLEIPNPPNLFRIDQATRATLPPFASGAPVPANLAQNIVMAWHLALNAQLNFYSNGAPPPPGLVFAGGNLVEGGDGYRHNVLRSDFDCLMRRIPSSVATTITPAPPAAPVRAAVPFCRVCSQWLQSVVSGGGDIRPGAAQQLDTQHIGFDWVSWQTNQTPATFASDTAFSQVLTLAVPSTEPQWSMTVSYAPNGASIGDLFQITKVQLAQRPGDPYTKSVDILKRLRFTDLSVTFAPRRGATSVTRTLNVHDAVTNTVDKPQLSLASNGGAAREYQVGAKLTLAWKVTSGAVSFTLEATLGLMLTGQQPVDPRTPTLGCRILPQFAMRIRRAASLVAAGGSISAFKGSVIIDAVNAIQPDVAIDARIAAPATGKLGVSIVSESNRAGRDSPMAAVTAAELLAPSSGRKLATVTVPAPPMSIAMDDVPLYWSHRYDYLLTLFATSKITVGAYHMDETKGRPTPIRTMNVNWPSMSPFNMEVLKVPKQGAYDAVIIHPVDTSATPVAAFPGYGDLGLVLPMRYGLAGGGKWGNVLGWGTGRLDQGSQTMHGAPLVPPNQHVDLSVDPTTSGQVTVTYTVTTEAVPPNQWQVFLSQGLVLGYSYGIDLVQMPWLVSVAAMAGVPTATTDPLWAAARDIAHPEELDVLVRAFYRNTLHPAARMYDMTRDGSNVQQAPEATSVAPAVEAL